jgi:hypothetical protein
LVTRGHSATRFTLSIAAAHHHGDRVGRVSRRFPQTLDKFAAPEVEQAELKAMVASTRADYRIPQIASYLVQQRGYSAIITNMGGLAGS